MEVIRDYSLIKQDFENSVDIDDLIFNESYSSLSPSE